jgi:hypothetical protein
MHVLSFHKGPECCSGRNWWIVGYLGRCWVLETIMDVAVRIADVRFAVMAWALHV